MVRNYFEAISKNSSADFFPKISNVISGFWIHDIWQDFRAIASK